MVKVKYIIATLVVVVAIILIAVYAFPSEEKKVKKQFGLLSEWVSKGPEETILTMAQKARKVGTLFAETCRLQVSVDSIEGNYTRKEIASYAARDRARFTTLSLQFYDLDISFPEKESAKATLTARLTGRTTYGQDVRDIRELECFLKKTEGAWLFSTIKVVEVLKK